MSLASLALRLAIIEALAPAAQIAAASPIWPTIAKGRVYDSRADIRSPDDDPNAQLATVAVYLVDSKAASRGDAYTFDAALTVSTIAVECDLTILTGEGTDIAEAVVSSDPAAEAALDILTAQILHALELGATGEAYRAVRTRMIDAEEIVMRDETTGTRYTRRTLRLSIAHPGDDWSDWAPGRLPEPAATVAALLTPNGYAGAILAQTAEAIGDPAALTPLAGIDMGVALGRVPDDLADADVTGSAPTT